MRHALALTMESLMENCILHLDAATRPFAERLILLQAVLKPILCSGIK